MRKFLFVLYLSIIFIMFLFPPTHNVSNYIGGYGMEAIYNGKTIYVEEKFVRDEYTFLLNAIRGTDTIDYAIVKYKGEYIDVIVPMNVKMKWGKFFIQLLIVSIIFGIFYFLAGKKVRGKLKSKSVLLSNKLKDSIDE